MQNLAESNHVRFGVKSGIKFKIRRFFWTTILCIVFMDTNTCSKLPNNRAARLVLIFQNFSHHHELFWQYIYVHLHYRWNRPQVPLIIPTRLINFRILFYLHGYSYFKGIQQLRVFELIHTDN